MKSIRLTGPRRFFRSPAAWVFMSLAFLAASLSAVLLLWWHFNDPESRHLRNLADGYSVVDLEMTGEVTAVSFSPDGKHLVAGTTRSGVNEGKHWTGDLRVWDAATADEKPSLTVSQWIHSVSFTPDGKFLAVACSSWNTGAPPGFMGFQQKNGEVRIYDFPSMKEWKVLEFDLLVDSAGFSPDGRTLAVSIDTHPKRFGPCELHLLSFPALETVRKFTNKLIHPVFAFSRDSKKIMFADAEPREIDRPETKVFDCENGIELGVAIPRGMDGQHLESHSNDLLMSVSYRIFFCNSKNGQLRLDMNKQILNRKKTGAHLEWATMSSDQRYLLAVEWEGGVRFATSKVLLEDYQTGVLTEVFKETEQNVKFLRCALSPDANRFAVGTDYYVGIRGKQDDPRRGHVLLFEKKAAPQ